jgi:hypothetical protein
MRKSTRTTASWLGVAAGIAGLEHGYFEILQGNSKPAGLMIASIGPPCAPEEIWNACEPALTILPNFLITGFLAVILGLMILAWSAVFMKRKNAGTILILLSVALLLFGGGLFPPLIGIVGGAAGTKINEPFIGKQPGGILHLGVRLWPWLLVILLVWLFGQFPVGYFFNDFLKSIMGFGLLLILTMLPFSVYAGYAHDAADSFQKGE